MVILSVDMEFNIGHQGYGRYSFVGIFLSGLRGGSGFGVNSARERVKNKVRVRVRVQR